MTGAKVELSAYTASLKPSDQLKAYVPPPVVRRADQLYELLLTRTRTPSRGTLIAALVQAAPDDPDKLRQLVADYEAVQVWQTLIAQTRKAGKVTIPRRGQGRPSG
jgi:hypothetical protein